MPALRWFTKCVLLCLVGLTAGQPQVQLGETTIYGSSSSEKEFFGGIPFAEPPIGELRFEAPVLKLDPGVPVLNATDYGPYCIQSGGEFDSTVMSEDCLTININRPAGVNESSALPVMVWVYGGGFQGGYSSMYDSEFLVDHSIQRNTSIIYANFNYRVGPLGFPQGGEAENLGVTNLGNKDVRAALTWVQNNIGSFGGDQNKVTVFGESAGSIIIAQLLLNQTFDLARAAILESGLAATNTLLNASDREDVWQGFVSAVPECANASNNASFDCLRNASSEGIFNATVLALENANSQFPFSPVIDGPGGIIPDLPSRLLSRGEFARIPFIAGTNLDEGTAFVPITFNSTDLLRQWLLTNTTPSVVSDLEHGFVIDAILDIYPNIPAEGSPFGTGDNTFDLDPAYKQACAVFCDVAFTSLRRQLTQAAAQNGVKAFAYLFADPNSVLSVADYAGVSHGAEVTYVYGVQQFISASSVLSKNMMDYWISFATSLDPNDQFGNGSRPIWTQYNSSWESDSVLLLNSSDTRMIRDTFRAGQIEFLNANAEALLH
ncbi:esterase 1 [Sanghuangporus baumii]|uniref:Carboxylic ester hydrolase n=1 Tax=Sanghuangporus baumii TaxID=108892 RepID=A0A9Q5I3F1_SANBA|nr:esterase 1 [Sanghuangporus baumii]